jgi:hypothetical protein
MIENVRVCSRMLRNVRERILPRRTTSSSRRTTRSSQRATGSSWRATSSSLSLRKCSRMFENVREGYRMFENVRKKNKKKTFLFTARDKRLPKLKLSFFNSHNQFAFVFQDGFRFPSSFSFRFVQFEDCFKSSWGV